MARDPRAVPDLPAAVRLFEHGRLDEAEAGARAVLDRAPRHADARQLLGLIALQRGWFEEAETHFLELRTLLPSEPTVHCRLARARLGNGRFAEAAADVDAALALAPDHALALRLRAELLDRQGDRPGAIAAAEACVAAHPDDLEAAYVLADLAERAGDADRALALVDAALARPRILPLTHRKLLFVRGRAHARAKRPEAAFAAWTEANRTAAPPYDPAAQTRRVDRLIAFFDAARLAALPRAREPGDLAVFVVGLPRCGSTLVEQIVAAHPRAAGAGEPPLMNPVIARLRGATPGAPSYPESLAGMGAKSLDRLAATYLGALRRFAPAAERIVDKNLLNFMHCALIRIMLPEARIIEVVRDPVENGLSCFMHDLSPVGFPWAGDLGHIVAFIRDYRRLMDHWHAVVPDRLLAVRYERLVADPEREIRAIVDFCGLPWDDACLRPHESGRAVTTLSYDQVRRPISTEAVGRAARFGDLLRPLREAFGAPRDAPSAS